MMTKTKKTFIYSVVFFFCSYFVIGYTQQDKPILLEDKSIVIESIYNVRVGKYNPPVIVGFIQKVSSAYGTPEEAAVTQFSAMWNQDYEWWLEGWSEESKLLMKQRDEQLKRTSKDWIERWKGLANKSLELTYRGDYFKDGQLYILIGYKIKDKNSQEKIDKVKELESTIVFKRAGLKWYAVQELMEDPVFNNILKLWHSGEPSIRVPKKMN